jgi:RNA polymerase sigma factor (sigma-70 family)
MIDQKISERFNLNDKTSLKNLYENHIDALFLYGKGITNDEDLIQDNIQDLFIYIWENREKLNIPASPKAYLLKAFKNRLIDHFRKNNKHTITNDLDSISSLTSSAEEEWINFENNQKKDESLNQALQKLSNKQKEIIHLRYVENMAYDEIAELLNINYQSVRNLVHRAIIALREEIKFIFLIILSMST